MKLTMKSKASALIYAIFISIFTSLISGYIITISYYENLLVKRLAEKRKIENVLISALNLISVESNLQEKEIDLFSFPAKITVGLERWGVYRLARASFLYKEKKFSKAALIGNLLSTDQRFSLYLQDRSKPLGVGGKAFLNGKIFLPARGYTNSYLLNNRLNDVAINGTIFKSSENLPGPDAALMSEFNGFLNYSSFRDSVIQMTMSGSDSLRVSFSGKVAIVNSDGNNLVSGNYSGKVILVSNSFLIVSSSCKLEDVVLIAPYIRIQQGFKGSLQCIAKDSITIEDNCSLSYPSALVLFNMENADGIHRINIGVNDSIMGQVIGYSMGNEIRNHLEINVSENSLIYGEVHCNGWLDLQGTVMGSVTTADLYYSRSGIFQNTFINGKIDILSLSKNYLSSNWMKQGQPRILKYENF